MSDARDTFRDAAHDGLRAWAEMVKRQTIANLPVGDPDDDPNPAYALADHVEIHDDGDGFIVEVNGVYAARQHEELHLEHPRGGGPKFLERAGTETAAQAPDVVASTTRARLAGGLSRRL